MFGVPSLIPVSINAFFRIAFPRKYSRVESSCTSDNLNLSTHTYSNFSALKIILIHNSIPIPLSGALNNSLLSHSIFPNFRISQEIPSVPLRYYISHPSLNKEVSPCPFSCSPSTDLPLNCSSTHQNNAF